MRLSTFVLVMAGLAGCTDSSFTVHGQLLADDGTPIAGSKIYGEAAYEDENGQSVYVDRDVLTDSRGTFTISYTFPSSATYPSIRVNDYFDGVAGSLLADVDATEPGDRELPPFRRWNADLSVTRQAFGWHFAFSPLKGTYPIDLQNDVYIMFFGSIRLGQATSADVDWRLTEDLPIAGSVGVSGSEEGLSLLWAVQLGERLPAIAAPESRRATCSIVRDGQAEELVPCPFTDGDLQYNGEQYFDSLTLDLGRDVEVRSVALTALRLDPQDAEVSVSVSNDGIEFTPAAQRAGEQLAGPGIVVELPDAVQARFVRVELVAADAQVTPQIEQLGEVGVYGAVDPPVL